MSSNSTVSKSPVKINPDLEKERRTCAFNVEELAIWWNGGELKLREKRERGEFHTEPHTVGQLTLALIVAH